MTAPEVNNKFRPTLTADTNPGRPMPMAWAEYSDQALSKWYALLSEEPEEDKVQEFLEQHPAMIPGGSGDIGPGGHHGSDVGVVFTKPNLNGSGSNFAPDFLWVTRSSGLITPILIEIEKPSKRWFNPSNRRPTAEFTAAHDQLNEWRAWFKEGNNASAFRERFLFLGDRYTNRPLEPQFVLIYGRNREFEFGGGHTDPDGLRRKRDSQRAADETFRSFDSLRPRFDHRHAITATINSHGVRPYAFSPTFETGPMVSEGALVMGEPNAALGRSVMMTDERKKYLAERWSYWAERERTKRDDPDGFHTSDLGRE